MVEQTRTAQDQTKPQKQSISPTTDAKPSQAGKQFVVKDFALQHTLIMKLFDVQKPVVKPQFNDSAVKVRDAKPNAVEIKQTQIEDQVISKSLPQRNEMRRRLKPIRVEQFVMPFVCCSTTNRSMPSLVRSIVD